MVLSLSLPALPSPFPPQWTAGKSQFIMAHVNQLLINPNGVNECQSHSEWLARALINMTSHIHTANHWLSGWETYVHTCTMQPICLHSSLSLGYYTKWHIYSHSDVCRTNDDVVTFNTLSALSSFTVPHKLGSVCCDFLKHILHMIFIL